jgi:hypothetical protein
VIAVPFLVTTGKVLIDGPEEISVGRALELPTSNYRLVAAQRVVNDEEGRIDLFFEKLGEPIGNSKVIVADPLLDPPVHLVETVDVA